MPQIGIQLRDVRRAVEALEAEGRTATPTNVRLQLGSRGSYTTIQRLLAQVKQSLDAERSAPSMSDSLLRTAGDCITTFWSAAHSEAHKQVEALERKHRGELESLRLEFERAHSEVARLQFEVSRVMSELAEERSRLSSLSDAITEVSRNAQPLDAPKAAGGQRQL